MAEQPPPSVGEVRTAADGTTHAWSGQGWVPVVWDGARWIPAPSVTASVIRARSRRVWAWVAVGAVVVVIGIIGAVASASSSDSNSRRGITNVSWTADQIKFDYSADKTCGVVFHYVFSDSQGNVLGEADDVQPLQATSGEQYHFTNTAVDLSSHVPDGTSHIDITPNCQ
jgi:hypothetical protein